MYAHTVCVKKNTTNVLRRHLKTWWHVCHFLPPKVPHFDGCVTVHRLVKCRNSRGATFKGCGAFCRENVARSPNCGAFGKRRRNPYPGTSHTNPEANHKGMVRLLIKKRCTNFYTNYCILLTCTVHVHGRYMYTLCSVFIRDYF